MLMLVAVAGPCKGGGWQIHEKPLIIGRGLSCHVVVEDRSISRRHCEVSLVKGSVLVRDLGSSNCTLVNGKPVLQRIVAAGDEISVGSAVFSLCSMALATSGESESDTDEATTTLGIDGAQSDRRVREHRGREEGHLRTVQEYTDLFQISRKLGHTSTIRDLLDELCGELSTRYPRPRLHIARFHIDSAEFTLHTCSTEDTGPPPSEELIREAFALKGSSVSDDAEGSTLLSPIAVGSERMGLLLLETSLHPTSSAVDFFAATACQVAPYFHTVEQIEKLQRDNERLRDSTGEGVNLVGDSEPIRRVRSLIRRTAPTPLSILITGETGTGKELAARSIHELSNRAHGPFIAVNCAAVPDALFESELFGHEKGAFSGAEFQKLGSLEMAHGGTFFLDEVGDLSASNQARLLRAIETGTFHRVGGVREVRVDVRVVAATNQELGKAMEAGQFRQDLYHRLSGLELRLPPLHDRKSDIEILARHFLDTRTRRTKQRVSDFAPEAMVYLCSRPWPGNVRELRNCIERALALAHTDVIRLSDVTWEKPLISEEVVAEGLCSLEDLEKAHIGRVLRDCAGNVSAAARILSINRSTLYAKIAHYRLNN